MEERSSWLPLAAVVFTAAGAVRGTARVTTPEVMVTSRAALIAAATAAVAVSVASVTEQTSVLPVESTVEDAFVQAPTAEAERICLATPAELHTQTPVVP